MIAGLPDRPTRLIEHVPVAMTPGSGMVGGSFADFLPGMAGGSSAAGRQGAMMAARSDQAARPFNEDGFFEGGTLPHAVPSAAGLSPVALVAGRSDGTIESPAATPPEVSPLPASPKCVASRAARGRVGEAPVRMSMAEPNLPAAFAAPGPTPIAPRAVDREPAASAVPSGAGSRPQVLRSPGACVAVAVRAVELGMEVVAHLATLDDSERARLIEEIERLLAVHGHAPARITVIARAPSGSSGA